MDDDVDDYVGRAQPRPANDPTPSQQQCLQRSVLSLILGEPLGRSTVYWWIYGIKVVAFWDIQQSTHHVLAALREVYFASASGSEDEL